MPKHLRSSKFSLSISWSFNFIFLLSISDNARPTEKVEWYQEHLKTQYKHYIKLVAKLDQSA